MSGLTALQQQAYDLAARGLPMTEIARILDVSAGCAGDRIRQAEKKLGVRLNRPAAGNPHLAAAGKKSWDRVRARRQREIDEALSRQPECPRCGLHGCNACVPDVSHYASSGESSIARCER